MAADVRTATDIGRLVDVLAGVVREIPAVSAAVSALDLADDLRKTFAALDPARLPVVRRTLAGPVAHLAAELDRVAAAQPDPVDGFLIRSGTSTLLDLF